MALPAGPAECERTWCRVVPQGGAPRGNHHTPGTARRVRPCGPQVLGAVAVPAAVEAPRSRCGVSCAAWTRMACPSISWPSKVRMTSAALSVLTVTKPKPRERPVSRSEMTCASTTSACAERARTDHCSTCSRTRVRQIYERASVLHAFRSGTQTTTGSPIPVRGPVSGTCRLPQKMWPSQTSATTTYRV